MRYASALLLLMLLARTAAGGDGKPAERLFLAGFGEDAEVAATRLSVELELPELEWWAKGHCWPCQERRPEPRQPT